MDEKTKLILEIIQLAYLVQVHTDYCVFIRFSGHIDELEIDIREGKINWERKVLYSEFYTCYRRYQAEHDTLAFLKAKRDILVAILQDKEIPYELCDVEEYIVREHSF